MNCKWVIFLISLLLGQHASAQMDRVQMTVWVNEAIVSTYSFTYSNVLQRQKEIAKYFTAKGWIAYSKALDASKLIESVSNNKYTVSAVATLPPEIKKIDKHQWQAVMPLLVLYKSASNKQTQVLNVVLDFIDAPTGEGVRGFAITSLEAKNSAPPCSCSTR